MQLDKLAIKPYSRTSWQAFDLGCRMATCWFPSLAGFWIMATLPAFIVVTLVDPTFGVLLLWLCKPLFERGLLYIFSRNVFGGNVTAWQALKAWPAECKKQALASITWRRLSLSRAFNLPVTQLEQLSGERRSKRLSVLHKTSDNNTGLWLLICLHWELFIVMALISMSLMLLPESVDFDWMLLLDDEGHNLTLLYDCFVYISWALVAPFYVGGSFAAYLNRRIKLESWDIELTFKTLSQSHKQKASTLLCVCFALLLSGISEPISAAQQTPETTEQQQTEPQLPAHMQQLKDDLKVVLAEPPVVDKKLEKEWRWTGFKWEWEPDEKSQTQTPTWLLGLIAVLANSMEVLLWLLVIFCCGWLLWLNRQHIINWLNTESVKPVKSQLPDFITSAMQGKPEFASASQLQQLLHNKQYRQYLSSLLVLGLAKGCDEYQLVLSGSMTETECLNTIKQHTPVAYAEFMQRLINVWVHLAWAHKWPEDGVISAIANQWTSLSEAEARGGQRGNGDAG